MNNNGAYFNLLRGLALASFVIAGPFLFSLDSGSAWDRAIAFSKNSERLSPRMMRTATTEYGKKGEVTAREEYVNSLSYGADGAMNSEIVSATKDGKDVTAERRAEAEKRKPKNDKGKQEDGVSLTIPDPMNPAKGASVKRGDPKLVTESGRELWEYPFEYDQKGIMDYTGAIRLDASSGMPFSMEYSLKSLPPGVKASSFQVLYLPFGKDGFVTDTVRLSFEAHIILFEKKMDMEMTFSDYADKGISAP